MPVAAVVMTGGCFCYDWWLMLLWLVAAIVMTVTDVFMTVATVVMTGGYCCYDCG